MVTPQKVLDEIASGAAIGAFYLGVQGAFQFAQLVGGRNVSSLAFGVALVSSAIGLWQVRRGIRAHEVWARDVYESLLWILVVVSVCLVMWVMAPSGRPVDQDMAGAQDFARRVVPFAAIPWLALLGYDLWRVRRPDVRALLGKANAEAR